MDWISIDMFIVICIIIEYCVRSLIFNDRSVPIDLATVAELVSSSDSAS